MTKLLPTRKPAPISPTVAGYRVDACLGRGGYASVWLAWRQGPLGIQIPVAIKVLDPEHAEGEPARRRFFSEARLLASLDHPNIIKALDAGESVGRPYYVMEYIRGTSLARLLTKKKRGLPIDAALQIGVRIGAALGAAHHAVDHRNQPLNIVHRDVNPANILLGRYGATKLIDFGIATSEMTPRDTRINVIKGNPRYLTPEQAFGLECDERTDVYALGLTIYEALTGVAPLAPVNNQEALSLARDVTIVPPSQHRPALGPEIDRVLKRALRRQPRNRYASMDELVRGLHSCLLTVNPSVLDDSLHLLVLSALEPESSQNAESTEVIGMEAETAVDDIDELPTGVFQRKTRTDGSAVLEPRHETPPKVIVDEDLGIDDEPTRPFLDIEGGARPD